MSVATPRQRKWWRPAPRVEDRAVTRATLPPSVLGDSAAGPAITPRNALTLADAYACVRVLADSAASLPLHTYRRAIDGGRERADDSLAASLLRRPAPGVTQANLIAQLMAHLALYGEGFVGLYRGEDAAVFQLGLIAPEAVEVEIVGGEPFYTVTTADGRRAILTTADVIHVRGLSLDGVRGASPVRLCREALGHAAAVAEHGSRFFRNGARPSGVLTVPSGPASAELIENLRRGFEDRHGGPSNAGRVAVLDGAVSFSPVSMPMADAQWIEARGLSTAEVARIFRVQPWMIGAKTGDSLTYSTVSEQARAFVLFSLRPWLVSIEQALGACLELFPSEARTYPAFELDGLLRGDPKARSEIYAAALNPQTGWMSRAEVRALEDMPAEPDRQDAPADA